MDTTQARQRLDAERQRLEEVRDAASRLSASANEAAQAELSTADQHNADQGTETMERELDQGVLQQVEAELAELDAAQARIEDGSYGTCEVCGKPISEGRLEVMPATRFCIDDQARVERDPTLHAF